MALTGILGADFSAFVSEGQKAEAALRRMEGGAGKVESSLNRMSTGPLAPMNTLRQSFGQVDQVLNASGVNVGKYARGLVEISEMSGKTAQEVGGLATAASVFGAAMAGWNFGRAIAGFFDLDTKVGNLTAKLLGWGDVAAEVGGAKQDVINRAIANGAAQTISYTAAIQFNIDAMKNAAAATAAVVRPQSDLMRAWNEAAEAADGYTGAWTKLHEASVIYGDGLPPVTEKTQSLLEVLDGILAVQEPIQSGLTFTTETIGELGDEADEAAAKLEAFKKQQLAGGTFSIQPMTQTELGNIQNPFGHEGGGSEANVWKELARLEKLEGTYAPKSADSYFAMVRDQVLLSQLRMWAAGKDRPPGFAGGVTNFGGGLARVHQDELLVNLPRGTDVIPAGRGSGGNTYIFNLSGMVGDRASLARTIKGTLVDAARAKGERL